MVILYTHACIFLTMGLKMSIRLVAGFQLEYAMTVVCFDKVQSTEKKNSYIFCSGGMKC